MEDKEILNKAHKHSINHKEEISQSDKCGCFHCTQIFSKDEIDEWIDDGETALCPYCMIDSVIGAKSGYPITEEFLLQMRSKWFSYKERQEG